MGVMVLSVLFICILHRIWAADFLLPICCKEYIKNRRRILSAIASLYLYYTGKTVFSSLVFRQWFSYTKDTPLENRGIGLNQENIFFHGSVIGGLDVILANAASHVDRSSVAYFTTDRVYALVCCRSKAENFVTMGPRDGIQHYFERFPDQLKTMYEGKEGFLYQPVSSVNLKNTKGHTWESSVDVPVVLAEHIPNVYAEILREEAAGNVVIHRYAEIDPAEQKLHANYIRDHLDDPLFKEYRAFLIRHFSSLWD